MAEWRRLRVYIGETDKYHGKSLYLYLLELFMKRGLKGATVYRAIAGYGSHSVIHHPSILRLSEDMPIIIEVVDEEEKIRNVIEEVKKIVKEGLVTIEPVEVVFYGHREEEKR